MTYLRYTPALETIDADEIELFERIAETFAEMGKAVAAQEGRPLRVSHAKATAAVRGELTIAPGLPPELAQGLAARPGSHAAQIRFAQGPGEILHDRVSAHRGMAVKLLDLEGPFIPEADGRHGQDFVLEAHGKAFINSNAATFFTNLHAGVSNAPSLPEGVKHAVSKAALASETLLEAVGLESKTLAFFGHPPVHPLSEAYFSQAPMRWGEHVGKVGFYPTPATLDALDKLSIDTRDDHDAFGHAMAAHFAGKGAEFELRVQLATDLETMPIEDAAQEWPEEISPYRTVAVLAIPPQRVDANDAFERLSFRPANSLVAHRPLGQVMRARLFVYGRLAALRGADGADGADTAPAASRSDNLD